jgi:hypothetical protein
VFALCGAACYEMGLPEDKNATQYTAAGTTGRGGPSRNSRLQIQNFRKSSRVVIHLSIRKVSARSRQALAGQSVRRARLPLQQRLRVRRAAIVERISEKPFRSFEECRAVGPVGERWLGRLQRLAPQRVVALVLLARGHQRACARDCQWRESLRFPSAARERAAAPPQESPSPRAKKQRLKEKRGVGWSFSKCSRSLWNGRRARIARLEGNECTPALALRAQNRTSRLAYMRLSCCEGPPWEQCARRGRPE